MQSFSGLPTNRFLASFVGAQAALAYSQEISKITLGNIAFQSYSFKVLSGIIGNLFKLFIHGGIIIYYFFSVCQDLFSLDLHFFLDKGF